MRNNNGSAKKMDLKHIREKLAEKTGRDYWKSLEEVAETQEFLDYLKHEFPTGADTWTDPVGRRLFLQIMGASIAFAGMTACVRQPEERVVPHVRAPEQMVPGKPLFFATAMPLSGYGQGLLAESHEGRPTKIEGNPRHPASLGAVSALGQASILNLYDPDRLQSVRSAGRPRTWEAFRAELMTALDQHRINRGQGLRILSGTVTSPTLASQIDDFLSLFPEARWHQFEPVHSDPAHQAAETAFGEPVNTYYDLSQADVIFSLDADFLFQGPAALRYTKDFSARRRVDDGQSSMNRLYMAESSPTITGTMADHRLVLRSSEVESIARQLATELGVGSSPASLSDEENGWIAEAARDLRANAGRAVVIPGDFQPATVHLLAHVINEVLQAPDNTVFYTDPVEVRPESHIESLQQLAADIQNGQVETLVILGGNPAFDAPADLQFGELMQNVNLRVHLTPQENETSYLCQWLVPESHFLESWSDVRAYDGTVSIVQPLIEPLYASRSAHQLLAMMLGEPDQSDYSIVRSRWERDHSEGDFNMFWRRCLHEGYLEGSALPHRSLSVNMQSLPGQDTAQASAGSMEVIFRPDPSIYDGRFANNGWLQELPKVLTKLVWDNAALVSPTTAEELDLRSGDVLELRLGEAAVEVPVWIQPGHPTGSLTLYIGYGRTIVGRVGQNTGFNVYPLRNSSQFWTATGVEVQKTGRRYPLVSTQDHYSMEGRHLVRHATLEEFRANPDLVHEMGHEFPDELDLYPDYEYPGYAWGMAVDLNACIGCNACVVACQAENNIPVVGKDQVVAGREMHWIRIDRYYYGSPDHPEVFHQPVMCQHCEKAPCEPVCPVAATVHGSEGLNEMVYNRCVGTRYCSNNCPYKVRRFNYFLYSDWDTESLKMQKNPDVTVRSRGVMEKCTYCVQRINGARIQAKLEDRKITDGEVVTACQQTCPADAIVFGDISDPDSRVSRLKKSQRNYGILTELNTKPRTTYLARLSNPNPAFATEQA